MGYMKELDIRIRQGGDDAIAAVSEYVAALDDKVAAASEKWIVADMELRSQGRWIPADERLPVIDPLGVTATVIVAHAEYNAHREPTGNVAVSPAYYLGSDQQGPFFKSMINGRRLDSRAWMPLPEPPEVT